MKLLFFCKLFIVSSYAFIIKPPNKFLLKSYSSYNSNNNLNITPIYYNYNNNYKLKSLTLKKNNNDDIETITLLSVNIIYNLILYSYIYYLLSANNIISNYINI